MFVILNDGCGFLFNSRCHSHISLSLPQWCLGFDAYKHRPNSFLEAIGHTSCQAGFPPSCWWASARLLLQAQAEAGSASLPCAGQAAVGEAQCQLPRVDPGAEL